MPHKVIPIGPHLEKLTEAFWRGVETAGEDDCWIWKKSLTENGYGQISIWLGKSNKTFRASRVSWVIHNGEIPEGYLACHKCDNPKCCNPRHIFLGTNRENVLDSSSKGRTRNGNKGKTHCVKGHPLYGANLGFNGGDTHYRYCRACRYEWQRNRYAAQKLLRVSP